MAPDAGEEEDRRQVDGGEDVVVGVGPRLLPGRVIGGCLSIERGGEDFGRLVVLRHIGRPRRRIGVGLGVGRQPRFKGTTKVGTVGIAAVAIAPFGPPAQDKR